MAKKKANAPAAATERSLEMPPLSVRADVHTVNEEERTVELIWSTGAPVERYDWMSGKRYIETLSLEPGHIRTDRLNKGGPVLDSHSAWSVGDILGKVVKGSVQITKKEARARVQFSKREAVEPIWQDVREGIINSVSVGYRVHKFEETAGTGNKLPIRKAVDWEPYEVSMVPVPADAGSHTRTARDDMNPCVIVSATRELEEPMENDDNAAAETIAEADPLLPPQADPPAEPEPNDHDRGAEHERQRITGITQACRAARLPTSYADKLIDEKVSLADASERIFKELSRRDTASGTPAARSVAVDVGDDPMVHVRAGIENALLHRMAPDLFELEDKGRQYRGMTLIDVAKAYLNQDRIRTTELSRMEIASVALGLRSAGMHTTSDFANLLADLPGKILRQAYDEAPQTFAPIIRRTNLADFKPSRLLQLGEAPALLEVGEHGEFKDGTMGESKEQYQLKTYGRKFSITRQALVNDDTDAFARVPMAFGRQARNKESDIVWAEITNNAALGDGVTLFHANHNNLAGSGTVINVDNIGTGRAAMRAQTGIDGASKLNVSPMFLIVPVALETKADQFVSTNLLASQSSAVNPFAGKLNVIAEPRLDDDSATAWYLAGSPSQVDIIVLGSLEGEAGPMVDSRIGFDVDGIEIKVRHDIAAKAVDFRGLYKNPGA